MQYINTIYQMDSLFICFSTCEVEPVLTQYSLISSQITSTAIATTGTQKGKDGADGENLEVTQLEFKKDDDYDNNDDDYGGGGTGV